MPRIEVVVALLIAAIPLLGLARRAAVPYPIVLVLGGLILGFVPGLHVQLDPNLVLLVFLPPLLYWESVTAPTDDMRENARWVWTLAVGLVFATMLAVAAVAHTLLPSLGWAAAFVLGAVVAPTDEVAAVPVAERLGVPRHVTSVIDGEALLNDAVSLVLYAVAVRAVVSGTFAPGAAVEQLVLSAVGATVIGLIVGWLAVLAWKYFEDPQLEIVVSGLAPFIAYVPADRLHWSGVLAVVVTGIYVNRWTTKVLTPQTRLQGAGWWETTVFLINVFIFIVLGMQLHDIVAAVLQRHSWGELLRDAVLVNVVVVAVRFAFVFGLAALPGMTVEPHGAPNKKHLTVVAMAGMRGALSLAAALGIPIALGGGRFFPERDLLIFLTFSVILVTLVGGGLLLPVVIKALRIEPSDEDSNEIRAAMDAVTEAALHVVDDAERSGAIDHERAQLLRRHYEYGRALRDARAARQLTDLKRDILEAQRRALLELRQQGKIDNTVLRRVLVAIDQEEQQLAEV